MENKEILENGMIKPDDSKSLDEDKDNQCLPLSFNEKSVRTLMTKIWDPDKIKVIGFGYKDFYVIQSKKNENDLLNWFEENGVQLEDNLKKIGYSWCYVFEIASPKDNKQYHPNIYMAIGKNICQITVEEFFKEEIKSAPDTISYEFCEDSIATMDLTRFYTTFEALFKGNMFVVRDASDQDINSYKIKRYQVRHLKDETPAAISKPKDNMAEIMQKVVEAIDRQTEVMKDVAAHPYPSMNDNNGIVAGRDFDAKIGLTDDQAKMIAEMLAQDGKPKLLE